MDKNIKARLDRLDMKLKQLTDRLMQLPVEYRERKPDLDAWSVLQILEHLRRSEELSGAYIRKKALSGSPLPDRDFRSWFREAALGWFLNAPFKFKAPKVVNEESFPDRIDFTQQMDHWRSERQILREWLQGRPTEYFKKQGFRHPLAGRMTVNGMLKFFEWHFDRHTKQIHRTLKKVTSI